MILIDKIIESRGDYITIKIIVSPNAKKDEIFGLDKWRNGLIVKVKEKPLQDKANRALIRFFAGLFDLKSEDVDIIKGEKSREKMLRVRIKKSEAIDILEKTLGPIGGINQHLE